MAAKRSYSVLGIALFAFVVVTVLMQIALGVAAQLWGSMGLEFVSIPEMNVSPHGKKPGYIPALILGILYPRCWDY